MKDLEKKVAEAIYDAIDSTSDTEGSFSVEIFEGDLLISVEGFYESDGYYENDYFNGTGAYVNTHAYVGISDVDVYDLEKDEESDIDIDFCEVERLVESRMAA